MRAVDSAGRPTPGGGSRQVTDVVRPAAETRQSPSRPRDALGPFEHIERAIAVGIAAILSVAAILALAGAGTLVWGAEAPRAQIRTPFGHGHRPLVGPLVIAILHTRRASIP